MKGTFQVNGHKISIELNGEAWTSDQTIKGSVSLEGSGQPNHDIQMAFHKIDLKKLKKKDPKAFTLVKEFSIPPAPSQTPLLLCPKEEGADHAIQDGSYSLALTIATENDLLNCKQLQLPIKPRNTIVDFLKIFETFKRCSIKSIKNKKESIEVKVVTPQTGELAQIDSLALLFAFDGDLLKLTYQFQLKKLNVGAAGIETIKEKFSFSQKLEPQAYLSYGQIDQDKCLKHIDEALLSWKEKH
jgi:hypothetical protein